MLEYDDECFQCGAAIVPRAGIIPMCQPCVLAYVEQMRLQDAWTARLSAMGTRPGKRTKRAERMRALQDRRDPIVNDNGREFGTERVARRS